MKNYLFLIFILILVGCTKEQTPKQYYIEPCEYCIMGYEVKNTTFHDSVAKYLSYKHTINIIGDSTITVTEELGQFLFNGNNFTYKVIGDSLILTNSNQRIAGRIILEDPNFFRLEVTNKFLKRIDMIKLPGKQRRLERTITLKY
jgi:hypothetical protein